MTDRPKPASARRMIINADDFGLSPAVNRGILEAFGDGVLTSTTMLVNLEHFEDAVAIARRHPDLPVGIHLSLLWGRPVSPPQRVPSLVDRGGCFLPSLGVLARRYFLGRLAPDELRTELGAQVRRFFDAGLTPTHVDTHKHVHCLPGVMAALGAVAAEFGIAKTRLPVEKGLPRRRRRDNRRAPRASARGIAKRRLIRLLCRRHRRILNTYGLRTTDHFVGIGYMDCLNSAVIRFILQSAEEGVTELMCHPGYADEDSGKWFTRPPDRQRELQGLVDDRTRAEAEANAIELISYRDL
jgi:hopanoid biosynthesis associated protein HpnK